MISFKGAHFPKDVILYAVFFYVRYGVSYRDLEAILEESGVKSESRRTDNEGNLPSRKCQNGAGSVANIHKVQSRTYLRAQLSC